MGPDDIEELRQAGLSDRDILDLTLITGLVNLANRVVLGLGVPLDSAWRVNLPDAPSPQARP